MSSLLWAIFVGPWRALSWLMWVEEIFFGFDFTDWYDFIPLGCLLVGLAVAGLSQCFAARPASLWLKGAILGLSLWPLYPTIALLMLAKQFVSVRGQWPQPMVNDPKGCAGLSPGYDFWFHCTTYFEAVAGAALVTFFFLFFANRERLPGNFKWRVVGLCGAAMLISILDPGRLSEWWMD